MAARLYLGWHASHLEGHQRHPNAHQGPARAASTLTAHSLHLFYKDWKKEQPEASKQSVHINARNLRATVYPFNFGGIHNQNLVPQ